MSTVYDSEIEKFSKLAEEWWDTKGAFKALHSMNIPRFEYLKENISKHFNTSNIKDKTVLDIGCGGGLVSEFFAKQGAKVKGIDATPACIAVAKIHAEKEGLNIEYIKQTPEEITGEYDIVLALEVIEHVNNKEFFLELASKKLKKNGIMFVSTINRNLKSLFLAKISAEYILNWLPKGTHEYNHFVKPAELKAMLSKINYEITNIKGINYSLFSSSWVLSNVPSVNYIATIKEVK